MSMAFFNAARRKSAAKPAGQVEKPVPVVTPEPEVEVAQPEKKPVAKKTAGSKARRKL